MWLPADLITVKSARATRMSSATGSASDFAMKIQCWSTFMIRFSPGRSSLATGDRVAAPTGSVELIQEDHGAHCQVGSIGERRFHRPLPNAHTDRRDGSEQDSIEERSHDEGPPKHQAHEGRELDIAKAEDLGLQDGRPREREDQENQPSGKRRRDPSPPGLVEEARDQRHSSGWEDHAVEDQPVLEVEEDDLYEDEDEEAAEQQD